MAATPATAVTGAAGAMAAACWCSRSCGLCSCPRPQRSRRCPPSCDPIRRRRRSRGGCSRCCAGTSGSSPHGRRTSAGSARVAARTPPRPSVGTACAVGRGWPTDGSGAADRRRREARTPYPTDRYPAEPMACLTRCLPDPDLLRRGSSPAASSGDLPADASRCSPLAGTGRYGLDAGCGGSTATPTGSSFARHPVTVAVQFRAVAGVARVERGHTGRPSLAAVRVVGRRRTARRRIVLRGR